MVKTSFQELNRQQDDELKIECNKRQETIRTLAEDYYSMAQRIAYQ